MADESNPSSAPADAVVSPEAPVKKKRAPRVKKVEAKSAPTIAEPAKKNRGGRPKRAEAAAAPEVASTPATRAKRTSSPSAAAGKRGPNRAATQTTGSPLADDLADLLQLEEENQRLRKSLAEKLRTENSDLRKRLGLK
ncbi:hypothetical protein [Rhizobium sp. OAE497]|uniref:hypothetical protein n=1 Tax=Rhizobium sp. OAE497 TaxID=2663796 RepID=UPI0018F6C89C